ncbi:MAG: glycoside hydrolase family 9 protein [Chthoniobacterales bacterium]|nr:glycoside hydrolase family 9 protein [Chthoniobacterales bacterium]
MQKRRNKKFVRALSILLISLAATTAARAADGYVRVNQVGYEAGRPMRAYLMTLGFDTGASFRVLDASGAIVYSAPIGPNLGAWGAFTVYALDFRLRPNEGFTISVTGPIAATSPVFPVTAAHKLYGTALSNALYFFQNERDGADFIPTPLRTAPGHLNDESAAAYLTPVIDRNDILVGDLEPTGATLNASGGWWDAGDYLKFVETTSFTEALMLIGVRDFPRAMGAASCDADFTAEARFGVEWLQRMWNDDTQTLYYQVGIGTGNDDIVSDHDIWRLPQVDDNYGGDSTPLYRYIRHRPVLLAGPNGSLVSPNLAGRLAAAFAEAYQVFRTSDPMLARRCLFSAEHLFDLANTSIRGNLLTVAPFDFYPETEWRDDLELGATELYFALATARPPAGLPHTDPSLYLAAAANWARAYIDGPNDGSDTLNLYDVSGLAHFELFRALALAGNPDGLAVTQADLLGDLEAQLGTAIATASFDPFGFGFPWRDYDSATHGAGLSVMAKEVAFLTGDASYENDSRIWLGNILGANGWGSSFIVGDGSTFPDCMQHQVANLVGSLDGTDPVLRGALVEGPNSFAARGFLDGMRRCPPGGGDVFAQFNANGAIYQDNVQSYSTVEPAIDLTAPSLLMFAWRASGRPMPDAGF